jgi:hypothetical protein
MSANVLVANESTKVSKAPPGQKPPRHRGETLTGSLALSPRHEAFARAIAEGLSGIAAYRQCISDKCTANAAIESASRMLALPQVAARVGELRQSLRTVLADRLGVRQETIARFLLGIIETPVGEISPQSPECQAQSPECQAQSPECQEYKRTRRVVGHGDDAVEWEIEQIKMPSKLEALNLLNKMAGWNEPEKLEHGGKLIVEIRKL